jgi:hypothetical protein
VGVKGLTEALFTATARASRNRERVLVPLDGTSLTLADHYGAKGFGYVGNISVGARGLKLINALALTSDGQPIGVAEQVWWSRFHRVLPKEGRPPSQRESAHWHQAVGRILRRYAEHAPDTKVHFLADREGDATLLLQNLLRSGHEFTIRSNATRKLMLRGQRVNMLAVLRRLPVVARMHVELSATAKRSARVATLEIRATQLPVILRDKQTKQRFVEPMTVVWAKENVSSRRRGIGWVLLTNTPIRTKADACAAVRRYTYRWRIEDFHRTWKSGLCGTENSQLRSREAVIKWATILAAVASRAERLRHRFRTEPDAAATEEFSDDELAAIKLLKSEERALPRAKTPPNLAQAIRWVADLGGYVGNRGSGPPGAVTISRGLERVVFAAELLATLRRDGRLR